MQSEVHGALVTGDVQRPPSEGARETFPVFLYALNELPSALSFWKGSFPNVLAAFCNAGGYSPVAGSIHRVQSVM